MGKVKKLKICKRSRGEVLELLQQNSEMWREFCTFDPRYQEELILFCMGKQGLRITYDVVFKNLFSPERHRDRLENFISSVLGEKIKIVRILQHEGMQLQEKGTFVIMDVVVQLEDGTLLNVEMQKIGYKFTVERTNCYLADLLMRQYNDVKKIKGKKFHFKDMSKVISIVIMENSPEVFRKNPNYYIHKGRMEYDSGVPLEDLFENFYICLDTYKSFIHTKINSEKEAWMLFLSSTNLEDIMEVCECYPQFIPLYQEVFDFGKDVRELLSTFSEALREMDRNEERYMIEEMQEEMKLQLKKQKEEMQEEMKKQKEEMQNKLLEARQEKEEMERKLQAAYKEIEQLKS